MAAPESECLVGYSQEMTERLWQCTNGNLGEGQLGQGITSELLVNVDSRASAHIRLTSQRRCSPTCANGRRGTATHGTRCPQNTQMVDTVLGPEARGFWGAVPQRPSWPSAPGRLAGSFVTAVLSNNLHEVHGYNRLASIARGEVMIIMQDDDMPPQSCTWLKYLLREFQRFPHLGAVGESRLLHPRRARRCAAAVC